MTREAKWRTEWEALRAERALARRRWRSAADGLAARARDPLGLAGLVGGHPIASAGIGAALGALLLRLFLRGRARRKEGREHGSARPQSSWTTTLRDALLRVALPWLVRYVKEQFGRDADPAPAPKSPGLQPAAAEASARQ